MNEPDHAVVSEAAAGFDAARLRNVEALCRAATESGAIPGLALLVARNGVPVIHTAWGLADRTSRRPAAPDTVWLIASVTKPVVCTGVALLMERGLLALDDRVSRHLPEFDAPDRRDLRLRHLLTHTSGLPDMLPENVALRQRHAPLSEFIERIATTPLLFSPGTNVHYQSTGIALLGEIVARVSGGTCAGFLRQEFFGPLEMESSSLGTRPDLSDRIAESALPEEQPRTDWDWNSPYWHRFQAPWGGMFSTTGDLARFLGMVLRGGESGGRRYLGSATVREITRNQLPFLPDLPESARIRAAWGLGWRIAAGRESDYFGDLHSPRAYGHGGSTGTGVWNDPETGVTFVLLTNRPGCERFIGLVSNAVAAAVI
jgi:CubicO group peptidase (beta-lactamase class C family)